MQHLEEKKIPLQKEVIRQGNVMRRVKLRFKILHFAPALVMQSLYGTCADSRLRVTETLNLCAVSVC